MQLPRFPLGQPLLGGVEVLIACWSAKGGSGTTVVAASLALTLARRGSTVTLADLAGDSPAALGVPDPGGPGIAEWVAAGEDVPAAALAALAAPVTPDLRLLARGVGSLDERDGERLAVALASLAPVVVDCGAVTSDPTGAAAALAGAATHSLLVLRPCFLSLRSAVAAPLRPSGIILVNDQPRALGRADVEDVLGAPVRAEVAWDPAVARAVDAGLLARSVPRVLVRALRDAA